MTNIPDSSSHPSAKKTILRAWITAGTMDMSMALLVYAVIMQKTTAIKILYSIASGVFGKKAYTGGWPMAISGLILHYIIALSFTIFYFLIYPYVPLFRKQRILSGLLYGIFAWLIMNLIVLRLVFPGNPLPTWDSALRGALILMFCIGLPISLIISRYYKLKTDPVN